MDEINSLIKTVEERIRTIRNELTYAQNRLAELTEKISKQGDFYNSFLNSRKSILNNIHSASSAFRSRQGQFQHSQALARSIIKIASENEKLFTEQDAICETCINSMKHEIEDNESQKAVAGQQKDSLESELSQLLNKLSNLKNQLLTWGGSHE